MTLLPVLASLVRPDAASPWLAPPLMKVLARVALRPKGVQAVVEFVLYIHPSNAGAAPTGSRGSGITSEALKDAASLIALPPPPMTADEWFSAIAPQLFDLLDGNGEPDMDKVAAYIIGSPILGKREFGHPGSLNPSPLYAPTNDWNRESRLEAIRRAYLQAPRTPPCGC